MTTEPAPDPDAKPSLGRHREMLAVVSAVVVLAFLLRTQPDGRVAFWGFSRYPLPHTCMTRSLFGIDCPACGLTRSMIHLAQGDWAAATRAHRLGLMMAFAMLVQFPYRLYGLQKRDRRPLGRIAPALFGYALILGLIGNWAYNQITRGPGSMDAASAASLRE